MTDDEYKINEECRDGFCGSGKVSAVVGLDDILSAMGIHQLDVDESEVPSIKMKHITTVNYMLGELMVAKNVLKDVENFNPYMEVYLDRDAREEFDDAIFRARRAVSKALDLLFKEVRVQNKVLDVWKEKEEEE